MVNLPKAAETQFLREIQHFEEENQMPYITSFERLGHERGVTEGIVQNRREVILEVLEVKFGEIPTEVIQKINQIEDPSLLKTLLRQAIALGSVKQFLGYLQEIS
jgi:hypothetical protein